MNKLFLSFLSIFNHKKDIEIYSIQELRELRQKEKEVQIKRKSREYISELNKKQRLWLEKNSRISRKVS